MGGEVWNNTFMANGWSRWATIAALLAPVALAACGGEERAAAPPAPPTPTVGTTARPVDLDPEVSGREVLRLQRVGPEPGAHDLLKYGSDGSAVIVQAYGGGGERIRLCTLSPRARRTLDAGLGALPLGPKRKAPPHEYISIYANSPARYTLVAGADHTSFTDETMPRDARPLVGLLEDTLYGRAAACRTTYRSRAS